MTTVATDEFEPIVTFLSDEEWDCLVQGWLDMIGLTYEELADMARRRDFVSWEAQKVWYAIP